MTYPSVMDEVSTLAQVIAGKSLARYGDGEFNLCAGVDIPCQDWSAPLQHRLIGILKDSGQCLVGIPNLYSETPKREFWDKYHAAARFLTGRDYVSAFISRPDSAPWINTPTYWTLLESLWKGLDVTVVRGSMRGLTRQDLSSANSVREIICRKQHAFSEYSELLRKIGTPDRVLLCCGPTATVLAVDLCAKGVHAIDIGHAALFLRKHRRGEPMTITAADKVA
jgi:hypothetical protein